MPDGLVIALMLLGPLAILGFALWQKKAKSKGNS